MPYISYSPVLHYWCTLFQSCLEATLAAYTYVATLHSIIGRSPVGADIGPSSSDLEALNVVRTHVDSLRNKISTLLGHLAPNDTEPEISATWQPLSDGWYRFYSVTYAVYHITDIIVPYYHPDVEGNCGQQ